MFFTVYFLFPIKRNDIKRRKLLTGTCLISVVLKFGLAKKNCSVRIHFFGAPLTWKDPMKGRYSKEFSICYLHDCVYDQTHFFLPDPWSIFIIHNSGSWIRPGIEKRPTHLLVFSSEGKERPLPQQLTSLKGNGHCLLQVSISSLLCCRDGDSSSAGWSPPRCGSRGYWSQPYIPCSFFWQQWPSHGWMILKYQIYRRRKKSQLELTLRS